MEIGLLDAPLIINSYNLKGRQVVLAEKMIPEGTYKKLRLSLQEPSISSKGRTSSLAYSNVPVDIEFETIVYRKKNTMVFIQWSPDSSVEEGYRFSPLFSFKTAPPDISSLLVFVTNEDSGTVSIVNKHSGEIVDTVVVGQRPLGITAGTVKGKKRVYVANSGSNTVSVIDPDTHNVEYEIPVRFGNEPVDVAVERVSADRELLFVANFRSNNISIIDPVALQELNSINVGIGPVKIIADPPVETVLNSRFLSFEDLSLLRQFRESFFYLYVANKLSNNISIVKMNSSSGRIVDIYSVDVGWSPQSLYIDYQRGKLYVANYGSDRVSVIDIIEVIKGNVTQAVSTINGVGYSVVDVISDPSFDRVYLLRGRPGELVVLRLQDVSATTSMISPVLATIPLGGEPSDLELDIEENRLLVVNRMLNRLTIIDKTMNRKVMDIPVGKRPFGLALLPTFY
jgi:YVTN family beta-propeller protein